MNNHCLAVSKLFEGCASDMQGDEQLYSHHLQHKSLCRNAPRIDDFLRTLASLGEILQLPRNEQGPVPPPLGRIDMGRHAHGTKLM